jgi:hypothetical protein
LREGFERRLGHEVIAALQDSTGESAEKERKGLSFGCSILEGDLHHGEFLTRIAPSL